MGAFAQRLSAGLARRQQDGLYRQRLTLESAQGPVVSLAGRDYLNFCSNDYLGLANHPRVVAAFTQAARDYGVGSGASQLVCGHLRPHRALEEALADFRSRTRKFGALPHNADTVTDTTVAAEKTFSLR